MAVPPPHPCRSRVVLSAFFAATALLLQSEYAPSAAVVVAFSPPSSSTTVANIARLSSTTLTATADDDNAMSSPTSLAPQIRAGASSILAGLLLFSPLAPLPLPLPSLNMAQQQMTTTTNVVPSAMAADFNSISEEQRAVAEAWRMIDSVYIDRTFNGQDWFKLRQDAVKKKYKSMDEARLQVESLTASLGDRYTRYLPPAKYDSLVNAATGNVCGVGVELAIVGEGRVAALDVEPSGPAAAGGLLPGDVFVEVDGVRFDDGRASPDDVAAVVRGLEGSKVGMVMERDGKTFDYILQRRPIKITAVRSYLADKSIDGQKVGVVRIKNFSGTTTEVLKDAIATLKTKGATSFVLDLRGNPGGLLPGGVDAASLFLEANKPVVYVVNKAGVVDVQSTLVDGFDLDSPLVLLVDSGTASAAEVFTAALKENNRAVIAGKQTFGKGVVQTVRALEGGNGNNGGIAITIARYETPLRNNINKKGIEVDVETKVDCGKEDATACLPSGVFTSKAK